MRLRDWWRRIVGSPRHHRPGIDRKAGEPLLQRQIEALEDRTLLHAGIDHPGGEGPGYNLDDHVHADLEIRLDGEVVTIPTQIGIKSGGGFTSPTHTHDSDVRLHVHAIDADGSGQVDPLTHFVRLADFFNTWRTNAGVAGDNPDAVFTKTQLMNRVVDATHTIRMYVDGEPRAADPDHVFHDDSRVVLSYEDAGDPGAPLMDFLDDATLLTGSPLLVPLNGITDDGRPLTFSVSTDDSQVTATVLSGNRSLELDIEGFGTMTFELFESHAPRATGRIAGLAESGFYDGITFHRVIDNFMIQGGDPTGTGAGGSALGDFDDQFHVDLQHNRPGILSMAKSTDDTNDSQFFITEVPTRGLDSNHTIFGLLVKGEAVRAAISDVPTGAGDKPLTDVVIGEASVFTDTHNAVLVLKAPEGHSGQVTVTVTVSDDTGRSFQRTFNATIAADIDDNPPFLDDIDAVRLELNEATSFQLTALDADGGSNPQFLDRDALASLGVTLPSAVTGLDYSVDAATGEVTVTASNDLVGVFEIAVGVRDPNGLSSEFDVQRVPVTIGVVRVSAADHSSGTAADDGTADTFELRLNGVNVEMRVNGELVRTEALADIQAIDLIGSGDDDTFTIDFSNGPPIPDGGLWIDGADQDTAGDRLELGEASFASVDHRFDDASSGSIMVENHAIEYRGLEPITDRLLAGTRTFRFGDGDDEITLSDDGDDANGLSRLSSTGSSERVDFRHNPFGASIRIETAGGNDSLTVTGLDPAASEPFTIDGGPGHDRLDASALSAAIALDGGAGNDELLGGGGDDRLNGRSGNDTLAGGAGDDLLLGGAGRDRLDGGADDDDVRAQGYSGDTVIGGDGSDLLDGGAGSDRLVAAADADLTLSDVELDAGGAASSLAGFEEAELSGGVGDNTIDASAFSFNTTLSGGAGDDSITGSAGVSLLHESADADFTLDNSGLSGTATGTDILTDIDRARLVGGPGNNQVDVSGFSGPTTLRGGGGDDVLIGTPQADLIIGGTGNDSITSGEGNDRVEAGSGSDTVDGGAGDDVIAGAAGHDSIDGGAGNDTLNGAGGRDTLNGGDGNDGLSGLAGADLLNGGAGDDTLVAGSQNDTILGGAGNDIALGGDGNDNIDGQGGTDTLAGGSGVDSVDDPGGEVDELFVVFAGWVDSV